MEKVDFKVNTTKGNFSYRVAALIINDKKLLAARNINRDCYYAVSGRVQLNETLFEAIVRELFEETGFIFEVDRLAFVQERFFKHNKKIIMKLYFSI